jgi:hypothetical protein
VVLLHGLTFDRGAWRSVGERLGDGVRSIAFDLVLGVVPVGSASGSNQRREGKVKTMVLETRGDQL